MSKTPITRLFSQNVQSRLIALGMNHAELARMVDCTPANMSRIMNASSLPRTEMIERIAMALECTSVSLFQEVKPTFEDGYETAMEEMKPKIMELSQKKYDDGFADGRHLMLGQLMQFIADTRERSK
jgi:transcriptional regulator with XRE-family HTH domain